MKTSSPSLAGAAFSEAQDEALTNVRIQAVKFGMF